jgi:acetylornithine/N-succinyldiaminopimelate aminotransferase
METYARLPVEFVRGEGTRLWDDEGNEYLDFLAGISVVQLGHCHPAVVEAIRGQAAELINCSNLYYTEPMVDLAEWLRDRSLGGKVFFCNSGAEASEAALKLARKRGGPGRPEVVALDRSFHGRTFGALALTGQPAKQDPFRPLVPGVHHVERNDRVALEAAVSHRTCAIFLEIIQGETGVYPLDDDFVRLARDLADRADALLVIDEAQTGLSRTGPLFAYQEVGVVPDLMCLAKSLGGGVPIGALVAAPTAADVLAPGDHGSTFAGSPLACAAGLAACRALADPALQAHVRRAGARLLAGLQEQVDEGLVREARGRGLMCAIDLPRARAADAVALLLEAGFLVNDTSERTIRFLPPLIVEEDDLDRLVAAVRQVAAALR